MKPLYWDKIRSLYPDIPSFRRNVAKFRVKREDKKLLSPEEVALGEKSFNEKKRIVESVCKNKPKLLKFTKPALKKLLDAVPELKQRKDLEKLKIDVLFCRLAYGFQPDEYWCFGLENQSMEQRRKWVSDIDRYHYVYQLNDLAENRVFNNKGLTYQKFGKYYKREAIFITSKKDIAAYNEFVQKHNVFVRKAVMGSLGRGIELVDLNTTKKTAQDVFEDIIAHGPHIVEERVIQGKETAVLNSSSVNTVRVITLNTRNGIEVLYTFMKVGRNGSFVDNGGAGGILVGIDKNTGVMNTNGFDELNIQYEKHPDSGIVFKGFQMPEWNKMLEICKEMSSQISNVRMIGWDMAYSNNGWLVIEGNGMSQLIGPQIVWQHGVKQEFLSYLEKVDTIV